MQQDSTTPRPTPARSRSKETTLILNGPARLTVERGRLRAEDGSGFLDTRQVREYEAPLRLERIIALSDGATWSDHALRMLMEGGGALYRLRQTGELEYCVCPEGGAYKPTLLRTQAMLYETPAGMDLARWLIGLKVERQEETLAWIARRATLPGLEEYAKLTDLHSMTIQDAANTADLMLVEARAADRYFEAWKGFPVAFKRVGSRCVEVPAHWKSFAGRSSIKSGGNRHATDPVNALLNFGYAIAAAESMIAIRGAGLEPSLGVLHADKDGRASFVYDVIEPLRPIVDRLLLEIVESRSFKMNEDFLLMRDGICRLGAELAADVARALSEPLRNSAAEVIQTVKSRIVDAAETPGKGAAVIEVSRLSVVPFHHPQTSSENSSLTSLADADSPLLDVEPDGAPTRKARTCKQCGKVIGGHRQYCRSCCSNRRSEVARANAERQLAERGSSSVKEYLENGRRKPVLLSKVHLAAQASRKLIQEGVANGSTGRTV